jgi:6-pyruvoyltetrahydropterin/6-carboxytetrahydropterin synthase
MESPPSISVLAGKSGHRVVKRYGSWNGWSVTYRQFRSPGHCSFIHGYALDISICFAGLTDDRGWVVDFGGLKGLKKALETLYDHVTVLERDDPLLSRFQDLADIGGMRIRVAEAVGCEAFCREVYLEARSELRAAGLSSRVEVDHVAVAEHDGNRAVYSPGAADAAG